MVSVVDLLLENSYLIMEVEHSVGLGESGLWHPPGSMNVMTLTWCGSELRLLS